MSDAGRHAPSLNERARFRLAHPVGLVPELVQQPAGEPDRELAARVIRAFRAGPGVGSSGPVWDSLIREDQRSLVGHLSSGDTIGLAKELSDLGNSPVAQGYFGGRRQHDRCQSDPAFADLLAVWTYDKLVSLAEALNALPLELPENGAWGGNVRIAPEALFDRIQHKLRVDLTPPAHVGGYLGVSAGTFALQMRVIEAIYAANRLVELAGEHGGRVCEIGAGVGLTAYYARLLGIESYTVVDLPTMNAVQGYMLAGSRIEPDIAMCGEEARARAVRILPDNAFTGLEPGSIDILYNQDSLPEIEIGAARAYLRDAARLRIPLLLSINQEARLPAGDTCQTSVSELTATTGMYRRQSRHRHWLRQGYLEEIYRLA